MLIDEQEAAALDTLPDDLLLHIVVAGGGEWMRGVPELDAVSVLGCLCKDILRQLYRLQPMVYRRVHSLPATTRLLTDGPYGPWRVMLLYTGETTAAVVDLAWRGHVRSIDARRTALTAEARRYRHEPATRTRTPTMPQPLPKPLTPNPMLRQGGEARGAGAARRGLLAPRPQARGLATRLGRLASGGRLVDGDVWRGSGVQHGAT